MLKRILLVASMFLAGFSLTGNAVAADPSLHEVYQAAEAGHLKQADAMMEQVLRDHPNSGKAHYVKAELLAKEGRLDSARAELATAERLLPGLPFAKSESVNELKAILSPVATRMAPSSVSVLSRSQAVQPASDIPWGLLLMGGLLIAAVVYFARSLMRPRVAQSTGFGTPAYAGGPTNAPQSWGTGGATPMGPAGPMAAPSGGIGSGILGGLATGAAMGAGMVAGEMLVHRMMDGGSHHVDMQQQPMQPANYVADQPDDLGGSDFGIADGGSWDDGSSSSGGDDWS